MDTLSPSRAATQERTDDLDAVVTIEARRRPIWTRLVAWAALTVIMVSGIAIPFLPAPFLLHHPGVVIDATHNLTGAAVTDVSFGDGGRFLLTTQRTTPLTWGGYAWYTTRLPRGARVVPIPRSAPPRSHYRSLTLMDQSKDVAAAVATCAVLRCTPQPVGVRVVSVAFGSIAHRSGLRPEDVIVAVRRLPGPRIHAGDEHAPALTSVPTITRLLTFTDVGARLDGAPRSVRLDVLRDGEIVELSVSGLEGPLRADLVTAWVAHRSLEVRTGDVGGPSTGLMLTLTLIDATTSGDLTGGRRIAGTGTIAGDGTVGQIGGVPAKVTGAARAGAEVFLVPIANAPEARRATPRPMVVVPVTTLQEALDWLCETGGRSEVCQPAPPPLSRTRL